MTKSLNLFNVQMKIYSRYHIRGFRAFYQKEDLWTPATEKYHGRGTRVEPYNILLNVEDKPGFEIGEREFTLIRPFTPKGKKNMRALCSLYSKESKNYF